MCEEFPRPVTLETKPGFDRRVVRVITPGTLIDEPFLNPYENNYLLAISSTYQPSTHGAQENEASGLIGLAWIDISTGEFFTKTSTYQNLEDELARIGPREIVVDKTLELDKSHPIRRTISDVEGFVSFISPSETTTPEPAPYNQCGHDDISTIRDRSHSLSISAFTLQETSAIKLLTTFLHANLLDNVPQLSSPNREATEGRMQIDAHTINALEIREGIRERGTTGSLLSVIKKTITSSGTRLLARWLCRYSHLLLQWTLAEPYAARLSKYFDKGDRR